MLNGGTGGGGGGEMVGVGAVVFPFSSRKWKQTKKMKKKTVKRDCEMK